MKIQQDFIPKGRGNRPGNMMTPTYITVHNTGNSSKGANAEMHARYVKNPTTAVSWHYTVDDGDIIYQHLPLNENGWHAGDGGSGTGNRKSIGIEICEHEGVNQNKANENAVWLIKKLMKEHDIPIANVVPHNKWSGKNCPRKLLPIWSSFIAKIVGGQSIEESTLKKGNEGALVSQLQVTLNKLGYQLVVDGSFGPAVENAVKSFQKASGIVVDGIVGKATFAALEKATQPKTPIEREEGVRMFKPTRKIFKDETEDLFRLAREAGIFSSDDHEKKVAVDEMPLDDTIGAIATIIKRVYFGGK